MALLREPHGTRADQFCSLLGPDSSAPRPDPHGPNVTVVAGPSDDGSVSVGGDRHGRALLDLDWTKWWLLGDHHAARADQLGALLVPDASTPGPDPRSPGAAVVAGSSDDRG